MLKHEFKSRIRTLEEKRFFLSFLKEYIDWAERTCMGRQQTVPDGCLFQFLSCTLFYAGSTIETEGTDRSDMELPGHQADLLLDVITSGNFYIF